ncbi:MAG: C39 family peptidase [Deltaproteobacteria bacterium]|nr:C39 family peptidase [Deltaproteobacteria bacterium]
MERYQARRAGLGTVRLAVLLSIALAATGAWAKVLDVPQDHQNNTSFSAGSCGSSSTAMALAYIGGKHSANWIEGWIYARVPLLPGDGALARAANSYCRTYLGSNCASATSFGSNPLGNARAQIEANRPMVIHTLWPFRSGNFGHYVTLVGIEGDRVYINDPANGRRKVLSTSLFLSRWRAKGFQCVVFSKSGTGSWVADATSYDSLGGSVASGSGSANGDGSTSGQHGNFDFDAPPGKVTGYAIALVAGADHRVCTGPTVVGATVRAETGESVVTDGSGYFEFMVVPGDHLIGAEAENYQGGAMDCKVVSEEEVECCIGLAPEMGAKLGPMHVREDQEPLQVGCSSAGNPGNLAALGLLGLLLVVRRRQSVSR